MVVCLKRQRDIRNPVKCLSWGFLWDGGGSGVTGRGKGSLISTFACFVAAAAAAAAAAGV